MQVKIGALKKRDYGMAIQFAVKGMHFDWYLDNQMLLKLYGRYFWYLEMCRATQVIAAYSGDVLAGVLLAEMKGEKKQYHSFWKSLYVKIFDFIQNLFYNVSAVFRAQRSRRGNHISGGKSGSQNKRSWQFNAERIRETGTGQKSISLYR